MNCIVIRPETQHVFAAETISVEEAQRLYAEACRGQQIADIRNLAPGTVLWCGPDNSMHDLMIIVGAKVES